jgi:RNA polymerase sigma factor (sigma-70 family)
VAWTKEIDPGERLSRIEDREGMRSALQTIPAKVRQVVVLIVYKGLSYQEAAAALDIPLGTVKSRMNSALSRLRKVLIAPQHRGLVSDRRKSILVGA